MKWRSLLLVLGACMKVVPALAADWRDALDLKPGKFPAQRAVAARYEFGWSGVKAAEAEAKFSRTKGHCRLELDAKTVGVARGLWRMDTHAVSTMNARTLRPVRLNQSEKYSKKSFLTTVDFSGEGVKRLKVPTPPDRNPPKLKEFKFSHVHDLQSALLFIRSQRLAQAETIRLCVYPSTGAYLAEIHVLAREKVKAAGREWDAIKCDIKLREVMRDFTVAPHRKFKKAAAWLSDDKDRLLLRVEAEVFVGSIWAELKSADFAK